MFWNKQRTIGAVTIVAYAAQSVVHADSIYDIAAASNNFTTLADLIDLVPDLKLVASGDGGSNDEDEKITVFAPTNAAFADVDVDLVEKLVTPIWMPQLQDLLEYHILNSAVTSSDLSDDMIVTTINGEDITINLDPARINDNSNILVNDFLDIEADNGIIHGIDRVLAPTSLTSNIVDIASGDERFSILVDAITAADLGSALVGDGPLTVFAPTNDAFDKLPKGALTSLLDNMDMLADILKYHVVEANALSTSLSNGDELETLLDGESVEVMVSGSNVRINDANVIVADIIANNGIIHAIDTVLLPGRDETTDSPTNRPTRRTKSPTKKPVPKPNYSKSSKSSKSSKTTKSSKGTKVSKDTIFSKTSKPSKRTKVSKDTISSKTSKPSKRTKMSKETISSKTSKPSKRTKMSKETISSKPSKPSKRTKMSKETISSKRGKGSKRSKAMRPTRDKRRPVHKGHTDPFE